MQTRDRSFPLEHGLSVLKLGRKLLGAFTYNVGRKLYFFAEQLGKSLGHGSERIIHIKGSLGTAEVRAKNSSAAVVKDILNGGKAFDNSLVVGDYPVLEGHVKIAAHKHALALNVNVFDGFLVECVHKNILQYIIIK